LFSEQSCSKSFGLQMINLIEVQVKVERRFLGKERNKYLLRIWTDENCSLDIFSDVKKLIFCLTNYK